MAGLGTWPNATPPPYEEIEAIQKRKIERCVWLSGSSATRWWSHILCCQCNFKWLAWAHGPMSGPRRLMLVTQS
ncbi:hypothetical protein K1T71_000766 [Dendrolimus kikuchii]|uniref:Uncharacterized protein n=1 Tax=Dendrolimus kikuchii TaxID=765133 RepID=A0ACC1DK57_9NEOP|nr:hypothetical protein K1T71_000766 [Dendrolimus kikuchii]